MGKQAKLKKQRSQIRQQQNIEHKVNVKRAKVILLIVGIPLGLAALAGLSFLTFNGVKWAHNAITNITKQEEKKDDTVANDGKVPDKELAENKTWNATIKTNKGDIKVELDGKKAPQAVANFIELTNEGWWKKANASCPRITNSDGFKLLQCGAPNGDQAGGPGYSWGPIENAPKDDSYAAGTLAMARQGDKGDSMGSQFFLVYEKTKIPSDSAGGYTVFGKVTKGLDIISAIGKTGTADKSQDGKPKEAITIESVSLDK